MWNNGAPTIGTPRPAAPPAGGLWNNAGPQINVQRAAPQPYYQRTSPQQQRDQYALGIALGASYAPPPQYQATASRMPAATQSTVPPDRSFAFGMGGQSVNGQISNLDHSLVMANLLRQQADKAMADYRSGARQDYYQVRDLEYSAKEYEDQVAAGGRSRSFYTNAQHTPQWMQYNQIAKNLAAQGIYADVESLLPLSLKGQNTGEVWQGFQATPIGTSFGGGDGGGDAWGTAMPAPEVARVVPQTDATRNRVYNGGNLASAHDQGSYQTALLRNGGYTSPPAYSGQPTSANPGGLIPIPMPQPIDPRYQDPSGWTRGGAPSFAMPGYAPDFDQNGRAPRPDGGYFQQTPNGVYEVDRFGRRVDNPRAIGGTALHFQYANMPDVQVMPSPRMSPSYATSAQQGQLDAYTGYNGPQSLSTAERVHLWGASPTVFDR